MRLLKINHEKKTFEEVKEYDKENKTDKNIEITIHWSIKDYFNTIGNLLTKGYRMF